MIEESYVQTSGLTKEYGTAKSRIAVLRSVDLQIRSGERVALLGKSGSGKSTLLHLLAGLDIPTSGTIRIGNERLDSLSRKARAIYRLRTVGVVFQAFHLIPNQSALHNVALPLLFAGITKKERLAKAKQALDDVGLSHRSTHAPSELSGGERQRVAVARALVNDPKFILADEPTGNLDTTTGRDVMAMLLDRVKKTQATLLLVTHDSELANQSADRVLQMADGLLI
jgi:putative ABC transport system ATP-binding protein